MIERFKVSGRFALLVLCAAAVAASAAAAAPPRGRPAQNSNQKPAPQQPKKKKLPPGARGFEQYANRDASDKLATGGATRGCQGKTFDALIECGKGFYEAQEFANSAQAFGEAAKVGPSRFRGHYYLGLAYEANKQYAEAVAAYRRATALKPEEGAEDPFDLYTAQYNLANSYALLGRHAEAIESYRLLIAEAPRPLAQPHYNIGLSLLAMNRQAEAVVEFQNAAALKPDYAEAHYNLGVAYSRMEQYPQAVAAFRRAVAEKSDYAEARYNLGVAYYLTDDRAGLAEQHKLLREAKSPLAGELGKLLGK